MTSKNRYSSKKIEMDEKSVEKLEIIALKKKVSRQKLFGKLLETCLKNWKEWKLDEVLSE